MNPILFSPNTTEFNNNGIGVLTDAISCYVTEVCNGSYELSMRYPVTGQRYDNIAEDYIILAKPNQTDSPQAFRIYSISKPLNGVVSINAEHISYQLTNIPVLGFTASTVSDALAKITTYSMETNPFTFWTDKVTEATYSQKVPMSARSILGGVDGSILDVYGGEYKFDNFVVRLYNSRGSDNGVTISYGKNLTGITCDTDLSYVVTGVLGYWQSEDEVVTGTTQYSNEQPQSYKRVCTLDCSTVFSEKPTVEQINNYCQSYLKSQYQSPKISVSVEFVNLGDSEEYKQYKNLESVSLCDIVHVKHSAYGIDVNTKVVKTVYDVILERYSKIEIGSVRANIANTIANQQKEQSNNVNKSYLQQIIKSTTNAITGNSGGHVVLYPPNNPQEILIMDTDDVNTATKVWRWNSGGLGYSSTGYNGPYSTAVTMNGQIVADFISAGTLQGIKIIGDFGSIGGFTMSGNSLTAEWSYTYPAFTKSDATKLQKYLLGQVELTDYEKKKYDTNFDGLLQSVDARIIQKIALGTLPRTVTGTVTIGSSDATEVVKILGTSGSMEGQELILGIGGLKAASALLERASITDLYDCGIHKASSISVTGSLSVDGNTNIKGYLKKPTQLLATGLLDNGFMSGPFNCNWGSYNMLVIQCCYYGNVLFTAVVDVALQFSATSPGNRIIFSWPTTPIGTVEVYQNGTNSVYVVVGSELLNKHTQIQIWGL